MILLPRLRAIIRQTVRGASYEQATINKALDTFITDMTHIVTENYLNMLSDETLENLYWSWERTAIKLPELELRIKQLMSSCRIYLPMPTDTVTPQEESNIVNLFALKASHARGAKTELE